MEIHSNPPKLYYGFNLDKFWLEKVKYNLENKDKGLS